MDWRALKIAELGPVDRVVGVFQVGPPLPLLPFPSFKVKVIERSGGSFLAVANVAFRDKEGRPDWEAGLGESADEALRDCLEHFAARLRPDLTNADFEWSDPTEF